MEEKILEAIDLKRIEHNSIVRVATILDSFHHQNTLVLKKCKLSDNKIQIIAAALQMKRNTSNIKSIDFAGNVITSAGISAVAQLIQTNHLTSLELKNNKIGSKGVTIMEQFLRTKQSLEYLGLEGNNIKDDGADIITTACISRLYYYENKSNTKITGLDVSYNDIHDRGLERIGYGLINNEKLKRLSIEGNFMDIKASIAFGHGIKGQKTLTTLNLSNCGISPVAMINIAKGLEVNKSLTELDLSDNEMSIESAKAIGLALCHHDSLTKLDLSATGIEDKGISEIALSLRINTSLKILLLQSNNITDKGATSLANSFQNNSTIDFLDLSENDITLEGVKILTDCLEYNFAAIELDLNKINKRAYQNLTEYMKEFVTSSITTLNIARIVVHNRNKDSPISKMNENLIVKIFQLLSPCLNVNQLEQIMLIAHQNYSLIRKSYLSAIWQLRNIDDLFQIYFKKEEAPSKKQRKQ